MEIGTTPQAANPGDLGWNLGMVLRGYQLRLDEAVEGLPCGVRGYQVLSTVVHLDPPNQQSLASHLSIDRTVLTYLLNDLESADAVERVPSPVDARVRKIVATSKGRELLGDYEQRVARAEAALLAGFNPADRETFSALLTGLASDVHNALPGANACEAIEDVTP